MISLHHARSPAILTPRRRDSTVNSVEPSCEALEPRESCQCPRGRVMMPDRARVANVMKTIVGFGFVTWLGLATARNVQPERTTQFFRDKVAPILERRCIHCHGERRPREISR